MLVFVSAGVGMGSLLSSACPVIKLKLALVPFGSIGLTVLPSICFFATRTRLRRKR